MTLNYEIIKLICEINFKKDVIRNANNKEYETLGRRKLMITGNG